MTSTHLKKALYFSGICTALIASSLNAAQQTTSSSNDQAAELAKKLQNPIAALISVPIQSNVDYGAGPDGDGVQYKTNFQPVVPIKLNDEWNVISRTIVPYVDQTDYIGKTSQSGIADVTQSLFFSPQKPTKHGFIWGAGPAFQLPTASDNLLGQEKWCAGPTAVVLKQADGWTYGGLVNHLWSFAGTDTRENVNRTFLQPFVSYTSKTYTSFGLNAESSYDWVSEQWTVPINLTVSQLIKIKKMPVQFLVGARHYAEKADTGPNWGLRFQVTLLFPQ